MSSAAALSPQERVPTAFVLMPFDDELTAVYEQIIKPALESVGYVVERADSILDRQNVLSDIVRRIWSADLIVADLTLANPNVFYELGLAHALRRPTVLLAQSIDAVPFDLKSYRVEVYSTHFAETADIKERLAQIGRAHAEQRIAFGSPVTDFLSEPLPTIASAETKTVETEAQASERRGFLDHMVALENGTQLIETVFTGIGRATEEVGEKLTQRGAEIERLTAGGGPPSPSRAHRIARATAQDLDGYANRLEELLDEARPHMTNIIEAVIGLGDWLDSIDELEQLSSWGQDMTELASGAAEGLEGLSEFAEVLSTLGGVSTDMDRATRHVLEVLDNVSEFMSRLEAAGSRGTKLVSERIGALTGRDGEPPPSG